MTSNLNMLYTYKVRNQGSFDNQAYNWNFLFFFNGINEKLGFYFYIGLGLNFKSTNQGLGCGY